MITPTECSSVESLDTPQLRKFRLADMLALKVLGGRRVRCCSKKIAHTQGLGLVDGSLEFFL